MGVRDSLAGAARLGLNWTQDQVSRIEQDGGVEALGERVKDRVTRRIDRLNDGKTVLNPEYSAEVSLWYARLEVEPGASLDEVRTAFRSLMRRYHPDRYVASEEGDRKATELSQLLTVAYEGLTRHLDA
ncbi:MAG: DnaJ-domain-containing protein 1 [Bradymonadia bacterium]|jgi:DnaJ-domain-containing protein 1